MLIGSFFYYTLTLVKIKNTDNQILMIIQSLGYFLSVF